MSSLQINFPTDWREWRLTLLVLNAYNFLWNAYQFAGGPDEVVELVALDGFAIRTVEEDEKYVEEPVFAIKGKDSKKGAKKK